jgi:glutamyl-tRNA synthetase
VHCAESAIAELLRWSGIVPDEGPSFGGAFGPYRQSERLDLYRKHAERLVDSGDAYYCFATKDEVERKQKIARRTGRKVEYDENLSRRQWEAKLRQGQPHVIRMRVPSTGTQSYTDLVYGHMEFHNYTISDQVLIKSDGYPSYHLANIIDDHYMGITHVLRGEEWLSSTPKHVILYRSFDWTMPVWCHLPLLMNSDGTKLSKRDSHTSVKQYQEMGILPEALVNFVALLGWSPDDHTLRHMSLEELVDQFSLQGINKARPSVDIEQLLSMNRWHLQSKYTLADGVQRGEFVSKLHDLVIQKLGINPTADNDLVSARYLETALDLLMSRVSALPQVIHAGRFFWLEPVVTLESLNRIHSSAKDFIALSLVALESIDTDNFCAKQILKLLGELAKECGVNRKALLQVIRYAVTGMDQGPELGMTMELIGKARIVSRLKVHL